MSVITNAANTVNLKFIVISDKSFIAFIKKIFHEQRVTYFKKYRY